MSSRAQQQAKKDAKAAKDARNAQIVDRIKAGEKRYMLAAEFDLSRVTVTRIGEKAGLRPWSRFGRQVTN